MPKVYLFDIDETLWCSRGPVQLQMLLDLRTEGHIVGLCGNLHCFMERVPRWWEYISVTVNFDTLLTLGTLLPKEYWLRTFTVSCRQAEEYVMVGNRQGRVNSLGVATASDDEGSVLRANTDERFPQWRFILEDDFATGIR